VELTRCGVCGEQAVRRVSNGDELDLAAGLYTFEVFAGVATRLGLEP
jgi:hypothetical protein